MKDYDVKYATIAFTNNSNITGKRLAYLVTNMFNKHKSGFKKQIAPVVETYIAQNEELPTITPMTDVTPVMPDIPEMVAPMIEPPVVPNPQPVVAPTIEQPVEVAPAAPIDNSKPYVVKIEANDLTNFRTKPKQVTSTPSKLLISTVFINKLINNRVSALNAANVPLTVQTPVQVEETLPGLEMLEESPKENKLEIAIQRYLELNNQRREALKSVNDFEAEMANLVKENGITLDMVKNAMNQAN